MFFLLHSHPVYNAKELKTRKRDTPASVAGHYGERSVKPFVKLCRLTRMVDWTQEQEGGDPQWLATAEHLSVHSFFSRCRVLVYMCLTLCCQWYLGPVLLSCSVCILINVLCESNQAAPRQTGFNFGESGGFKAIGWRSPKCQGVYSLYSGKNNCVAHTQKKKAFSIVCHCLSKNGWIQSCTLFAVWLGSSVVLCCTHRMGCMRIHCTFLYLWTRRKEVSFVQSPSGHLWLLSIWKLSLPLLPSLSLNPAPHGSAVPRIYQIIALSILNSII